MSTESKGHPPSLHIVVNRRKFEAADGVKPTMTGAEIAALVGIAPDRATVRWENGPHKDELIPVDTSVQVHNGDHFLATRSNVEGG